MSDLKAIEFPVKEELLQYKRLFKNSLKSETKLVDILAGFVHSRKQNKLLPVITLLSAKVSGEITNETYIAASVINHLYTATLIHDDVEDESFTGKLFSKIDSLWKTKLSVLLGDYFLAKGLILSVSNKNYHILEIVSNSVKQITEGELSIIHDFRELSISQNNYFDIIYKKSASLYSACTTAGAISAGADEDSIKTLASFGHNYGIAVYIKNELQFHRTIKNSRYRITLPMILALENLSKTEREKTLKYLQYPVSTKLTRYFQSFTERNGGIESSMLLMEDYKTKALEDITEFPYSASVEALKQLVNLN